MDGRCLKALFSGILFVLALSNPVVFGQESVDYGKVTGDWDMEIDAAGEYFYLYLTLKKSTEGLEGMVSESSGSFSDIPLAEIEFDGKTISFVFTVPTPPDGAERAVRAEFEVGDNAMEGTLYIDDLGMTALATCTREKK